MQSKYSLIFLTICGCTRLSIESTLFKTMARIFSIEFPFNNASEHAMIAVRTTAFYTEYKIALQSPELTELLLSDKIISVQPGVFLYANVSEEEYNEMMKQILGAVAGHVHSRSNASKF